MKRRDKEIQKQHSGDSSDGIPALQQKSRYLHHYWDLGSGDLDVGLDMGALELFVQKASTCRKYYFQPASLIHGILRVFNHWEIPNG